MQNITINTLHQRYSSGELLMALLWLSLSGVAQPYPHYFMAGEAMPTKVLLQTRLSMQENITYSNVHDKVALMQANLPGAAGWVRFVWKPYKGAAAISYSPWIQATQSADFIVRYRITGLSPGQCLRYALQYGADSLLTRQSPWQQAILPAGNLSSRKTSLVMVTGSHLSRFYLGGGFGKPSAQGVEAYTGEDKLQGFHGFESIVKLKTDFFIGNGDNVYYDHPDDVKATTESQMRAMWHRQFAMPRIRQMMETTSTYWMKDDHDHRFDDSDTLPDNSIHGSMPSHEEGRRMFIEQVPLHLAYHPDSPTYRTIRMNKWLQIWLLEARDHRSPNSMPDGPEKSMWGKAQKQWLQQTLLESNAIFKLIVTPTPMVGPDDARKRDNHANPDGFIYEGDAFFAWLKEKKFSPTQVFILTGDRHWQYHSIHPSGFQELSSGAMVDQNARMGVPPGAPYSSDPEGRIVQPYTNSQPSGGFLQILFQKKNQRWAQVSFRFRDEYGRQLYHYTVKARTTPDGLPEN
jgi:alkaline phosphatase/alkaline phosphatase D